jgi:hypothetical protein
MHETVFNELSCIPGRWRDVMPITGVQNTSTRTYKKTPVVHSWRPYYLEVHK